MEGAAATLTVFSFLLTVLMIFWRPKGLNEAAAAVTGAALVLLSGSVTMGDLKTIAATVSGAAITILATIVTAIVLESTGVFAWAAQGLVLRAKHSGIRLYWYINLVCFLMTIFFNNDGSILITTPILILLLHHLGLKNHQKIPYLLSGALVATASSAPIGVSNIVNLVSLNIVGMDLYDYTRMMFVPAMLGLLLFTALLFICTFRDLPKTISADRMLMRIPESRKFPHPLQEPPDLSAAKKRSGLIRNLLLFVLLIRIGIFTTSYFGIPIEWVAVGGSLVLLGWRWWHLKKPPADILVKTPWHVFIFAFGMYVIIYGLKNIGLTEQLMLLLKPAVTQHLLNTGMIMGLFMTVMSLLFNNHPALMIGTLAITQMGLTDLQLKMAYLANVAGSDIGSLILPCGTLASLMWMHLLRRNKIRIDWMDYTRVTFPVIPPTVIFTLICLYYWISYVV